MDLGAPVLQVEVGQFGADRKQALAVLHPRKLSIYNLTAEVPAAELRCVRFLLQI